MKNVTILLAIFTLLACNDGNIDVPEFVFDGNPQSCGGIVLYKTNANEALSITINDDDFLTTERTETQEIDLNGSNSITYRTFDSDINGSSYFCQNIPPTEPNLINEWNGTGTLLITTVLTFDDGDGIEEEVDDDKDTDSDGIPNYQDFDDDGDGISTINEDVDGDGDPTNDDTDGDGDANYLDDDDDGDGTPTREEPIDENDDGIDDYLDPNFSGTQVPKEPQIHNWEEIYTSELQIKNLNLTNSGENSIRRDLFDFGSITEKVPKEKEEVINN